MLEQVAQYSRMMEGSEYPTASLILPVTTHLLASLGDDEPIVVGEAIVEVIALFMFFHT